MSKLVSAPTLPGHQPLGTRHPGGVIQSSRSVASRQDAREGGFVASCDCARLGTRARVAGWDLLVVIL